MMRIHYDILTRPMFMPRHSGFLITNAGVDDVPPPKPFRLRTLNTEQRRMLRRSLVKECQMEASRAKRTIYLLAKKPKNRVAVTRAMAKEAGK